VVRRGDDALAAAFLTLMRRVVLPATRHLPALAARVDGYLRASKEWGSWRLRRHRPTVAAGWDHYAAVHLLQGHAELGTEWNSATELGMTVPDDEIVRSVVGSSVVPFLAGKDVIEIGSGGGRFTVPLTAVCRSVVAVDSSPRMLEIARRRCGSSARFLLGDGRTLPVPDGTAGGVFSYDVFVHLSAWDTFNYLSEIHRVLRPGGVAVIHHANSLSPLGWRKFLADLPWQVGEHPYWGSFPFMTPAAFGDLAKRAGFDVVTSDERTVPRDAITTVRKPEDRRPPVTLGSSPR